VNQFWKKIRKQFSRTNPPINGFLLSNDTVVSSPNEMCGLAKSFYEDQFSKHSNTFTSVEIEAENIAKQLEIEIKVHMRSDYHWLLVCATESVFNPSFTIGIIDFKLKTNIFL
jgi:hypothetical protein